jgi:hypothetical protein
VIRIAIINALMAAVPAVTAAFLIFSTVATAQSNPAGPAGVNQQVKPEADNNKPARQQQGGNAVMSSTKDSSQPNPDQPINRNSEEGGSKSSSDWWMVELTAVIAVIGFIQTLVFAVQAHRLRQTIKKMDEIASGQTADMAKSIAEAARAAVAMERVGGTLEQTNQINRGIIISQRDAWRQQMRAYIYADTWVHVRKNRITGLKFEFRPNIINHGLTLANKVRMIARCDIRGLSVPDEFNYSVGDGEEKNTATLFPRQTKFISSIFGRHLTRTEIRSLLRQNTVFHLWGTIFYEDVFNEPQRTNFSFVIPIPARKGAGALWRLTEKHSDAT